MGRASHYYHRYQLQCQPTGAVKVYKRMKPQEARKRNEQLEAEESYCVWVATPNHEDMPSENIYVSASDD